MSAPIDQLADRLPRDGLTMQALRVLDFIAPGQYVTVTGFDNMLRVVAGDGDAARVARIRRRALEVDADESEGCQRPV